MEDYTLLDFIAPEAGQNQRLRDAKLGVDRLKLESGELKLEIQRMLELDRVQAKQIARLEAVVYALIQLIHDTKLVPRDQLAARIQEAVRSLEPAPEPAAVPEGHPYRGGKAPAARKKR